MKSTFFCAVVAAMVFISGYVAFSTAEDNPSSKKWYKGNTHTHSLWSDGNDFPEMIVDWYKKQDYDFLALSDHNILSVGERWMDVDAINNRSRNPKKDTVDKYIDRFGDEWVETRQNNGKTQVRLKTLEEFRPTFEEAEKFLMIQAEEITDSYNRRPVHMNAINLPQILYPQHGESVRDTMRNNMQAAIKLERESGQPILVHLNHPNFGFGVNAEDLAHVIEERFFEVYNGHPGINHNGGDHSPGDERMWDIANTIRLGELKALPLYGVATDDSHTYHGGNVSPGRGWIMVHAEALTPESLILAMRAGDFYSSSGVTLKDIRYDKNKGTLTVEIDVTEGETYTTQFIGTLKDYDSSSEPRTDAEGKELPFTRIYSKDVGQTLATVKGTTATYKLTGKELYIRATISSDAPPVNPSYKDQLKQAWTQPVGWETLVEPASN